MAVDDNIKKSAAAQINVLMKQHKNWANKNKPQSKSGQQQEIIKIREQLKQRKDSKESKYIRVVFLRIETRLINPGSN